MGHTGSAEPGGRSIGAGGAPYRRRTVVHAAVVADPRPIDGRPGRVADQIAIRSGPIDAQAARGQFEGASDAPAAIRRMLARRSERRAAVIA